MAQVSQTSGVNPGGSASVGNLQLQSTPAVYTNPNNIVNTNNTNTGGSTAGGAGSGFDIGQIIGSILGSGTSVYGSQNAAEDITKGNNAAISTQQNTLGNINTLFQPQTSAGNGAFGNLSNVLGLNGGTADYSSFLNMPGYKFAVDQGTQAIQRQATASGSAFTPNTMAAVGKYVTGTAMQDYNTYVNQLLSTAGYGAQANNTLAQANLQVGGNISQLQANTGVAQAGGVNSGAGTVGNFLNGPGDKIIGGILDTGANWLTGGTGGVGGAIKNWLGGGSTPAAGAGTGATGAGTAAGGDAAGAGGAGVAAADMTDALSGLDASTASTIASDAASSGMYTYGMDTLNAASSGGVSGSSAGAAAAGGSWALGAVGAAAPVAAALYGATKPGVELSSDWYNGIGNSVKAGIGPNATVQQKLLAATQLQSLGLMTANGKGGGSGMSTVSNFDPNRALQVLAPYGITTLAQAQQLAQSLLDSIPPGQMPGGNVGAGGRENTSLMNSVGNLSGYIKPV